MNIQRNEVIDAATFLQSLAERSDSANHPLTVQYDVIIDGRKTPLKSLHLTNITFTGTVLVEHYRLGEETMIFKGCNFLGNLLSLRDNQSRHLSILDCAARYLDISRCEFDSASIGRVDVEKILDISGFSLKERFHMNEVSFDELCLFDESTYSTIRTPYVQTDNFLVAEHFRLAGIPVFMSSRAVRARIAAEEQSGKSLELAHQTHTAHI